MRHANVVAIVQARMDSTRLPGKVLRNVNGRPLIDLLLERLSAAKTITQIVVAIPDTPSNDVLAAHLADLGITVFRGDEVNVLERFIGAIELVSATTAIRITADCPLVDPLLLDEMVAYYLNSDFEYFSNVLKPTFPDGLDIEIFDPDVLYQTREQTTQHADLEHVTLFARNSGRFHCGNFLCDEDLSGRRWTVDEPADLSVIDAVFTHFGTARMFTWQDVRDYQDQNPEVFSRNRGYERNEGMVMSTGQKLWKRAKQVIPGGNSLLSKRPEMFLPDQWPTYFSRCHGAEVWDLDGNRYIDMSIMGIGTNILGYGHEAVDNAVRDVVDKGNMSTLNCPEEVWLAERLVELHPWADMVRFARTGGEANAIAVRIARAATGKSKIAFCGYHGWHDWYLSSNLADDSHLDGHLLPGLSPSGVPRELVGTAIPFAYNDLNELESILSSGDVAAVVMEVSRNFGPSSGFLESVREAANKHSAVLIFDECTSGFRATFGGLHKEYGVDPDIAMFGKALGNGYAITAVVGRRNVMEAGQTTFISSTFWTERIGPTAALATLRIMEDIESWSQITEVGKLIQLRWNHLAAKSGVPIAVSGLPALSTFAFSTPEPLVFKSLFTKLMLERGYLASTALYVSTAHTPEIIESYFEAFEDVFRMLHGYLDDPDPARFLMGPVCHGGFRRLN